MSTIVDFKKFRERGRTVPTLVLVDLHHDLFDLFEVNGESGPTSALDRCAALLKRSKQLAVNGPKCTVGHRQHHVAGLQARQETFHNLIGSPAAFGSDSSGSQLLDNKFGAQALFGGELLQAIDLGHDDVIRNGQSIDQHALKNVAP